MVAEAGLGLIGTILVIVLIVVVIFWFLKRT